MSNYRLLTPKSSEIAAYKKPSFLVYLVIVFLLIVLLILLF